MKSWLMSLSGCIAFAPLLSAQVSVEVVLDQEQFLAGESVTVGVRITNFSGQTLLLGQDDDWLQFTVESRDGTLVSRLGTVPVRGEFAVESSKVATKRIDLSPCFALVRTGRYLVAAVVKLPEWNKELISPPKSFDVFTGTKLWEQDFGVPDTSGTNRPPEVRKYALQQAIHLKQMRLYVRVTDQSENRVFRVFPIGPLVSFSKPECQIDKSSLLHVLYQTGARSFNYSVIDPDGRLVGRRTHEYTDTRPVLRLDPEGRIVVSGGARRVTPDDLPPAETGTPNAAESPKP